MAAAPGQGWPFADQRRERGERDDAAGTHMGPKTTPDGDGRRCYPVARVSKTAPPASVDRRAEARRLLSAHCVSTLQDMPAILDPHAAH